MAFPSDFLLACGVVGEDAGDRVPEARRVVHLLQMRELVHDHVIHKPQRHLDEPPVEMNAARRVATAPAGPGVGKTDLGRRNDQKRPVMRDAVVKAVNVTELRNRFLERGIELIGSASTEEFAAFLRKQVEEFAILARQAGMTAK